MRKDSSRLRRLNAGWRGSGAVAMSRVTDPRAELRPQHVSINQVMENPIKGPSQTRKAKNQNDLRKRNLKWARSPCFMQMERGAERRTPPKVGVGKNQTHNRVLNMALQAGSSAWSNQYGLQTSKENTLHRMNRDFNYFQAEPEKFPSIS